MSPMDEKEQEMYRLTGVILGSIVIATACLACSPAGSHGSAGGNMNTGAIVVTEHDNGGSIQISKGAVLTIRLETVPGTGYDWTLIKHDTAALRLIGAEPEITAKSMPGTPAHKAFRFMSEQSGRSTVELHYVRPWDKGAPPKNTYRLQVDVK